MGWLTAITEFFKTYQLVSAQITELNAWFKKANDEKWFLSTAEAFKPLESGQTTVEQKDAAAKAIADSIHGI